jgi:hypothetical protein
MIKTYSDIIRLLDFKYVGSREYKWGELEHPDPREFKSDLYDIFFTKLRDDGNRFDIVKSRDGKYSILFYELTKRKNEKSEQIFHSMDLKHKEIFENFKDFVFKISDVFKHELRTLKISKIIQEIEE